MEGDIIEQEQEWGTGKVAKEEGDKNIKKNDIKEMENRRKYKREEE